MNVESGNDEYYSHILTFVIHVILILLYSSFMSFPYSDIPRDFCVLLQKFVFKRSLLI